MIIIIFIMINKNNRKYLNKFIEIEKNIVISYHRTANPQLVVEHWKTFILKSLYNGFDEDDIEYYDQIYSIRGNIEKLIKNEDLSKFEEHKLFIEKIYKLDEYFKKITFESDESHKNNMWWLDRILKYSYAKYRGFLNDYTIEKFGIEILHIKEMKKNKEMMKYKKELEEFDTSFF